MPRSSQRNRYVSSPTGYWLTLLNSSEFVEQKGKPHPAGVYIIKCFILHSSCFREAQLLPCFPWWAQGSYQWKPIALEFTFTGFKLFPPLGNLSPCTGECPSGGRRPSSVLTPPAVSIFQPAIYFLLQDWKSLAVYAALASPTVSERSLTIYSPVPAVLSHIVYNARRACPIAFIHIAVQCWLTLSMTLWWAFLWHETTTLFLACARS